MDEFDEYLSDFTQNNSSDKFSNQDELLNSPEWEMTRQKASELLKILKMNHSRIKIKKKTHTHKDGQVLESIARTLEPGSMLR
ncbi:hypothetical protein [Paenibacillus dendritiformis]|uniref:hypothetical protein n=1 Tax=Paenibacillus dendritiformis TaxID=130049 RepID=UPI00387E1068